jgi:hypothetical protein
MRSRIESALAVTMVVLVAAAPVEAGYVNAVLADSPFAYYRLQEPNAVHTTTAVNSGSTGIDGTYYVSAGVNGSFTDVPSMAADVTPAKQFNRVDADTGASIAMPAQGIAYSALSACTVEFMIKPANYSAELKSIYSTEAWDVGSMSLRMNGSTLEFAVGGNSVNPGIDLSSLVSAGSWAHVAAVYDVVGSDANVKYYVNGALVNVGGASAGGATALNFNASGSLGEWYGSQPRAFDGALDEFAVYNTALTGVQIGDHYAALMPEPSSIAIVVTGLIGMLCYAWRKRK